jgi:AbiV family abortive infection protein
MNPTDPQTAKIIEACRSHAQDLFQAAQRLKNDGLPHVAYHLATLALEELGKAQLVGMRSHSTRDEDSSWHEKQIEDHVKKIFWALWGPSLATQRPKNSEIDSLRHLATTIHDNRLRGLYVSSNPTDFILPREVIPDDLLAVLMELVEARLNLEPPPRTSPPSEEALSLLRWFADATDDSEKRKFVFSAASFDRMERLANPIEWLKWLQAELTNAEREALALLNKELQRTEPGPAEAGEEKWHIKIRIFSQSHSIRPKPLNEWNEKVTWVKLYPVDKKKDQLLVEFRLPKAIPLQGLWFAGFGYANTLVAALNIGSLGFFWWFMPIHIKKFYESIIDLENNIIAGIVRNPELRIGWPNATLDSTVLRRVMLFFAMMPHSNDRSKHEPFSHYLTGVALLAKTDIFLQFEVQSYGAFLAALRSGTLLYGDQTEEEDFESCFDRLSKELISDETFRKKQLNLMKAYDSKSLMEGTITLSEVAEMKLVCDAYFSRVFSTLAQSRAGGSVE